MIVSEFFATRKDGTVLNRTYSDSGYRILQSETGVVYDDAVDVMPCAYTYTETTEPIEGEELTDSEALYILTGGEYGEAK